MWENTPLARACRPWIDLASHFSRSAGAWQATFHAARNLGGALFAWGARLVALFLCDGRGWRRTFRAAGELVGALFVRRVVLGAHFSRGVMAWLASQFWAASLVLSTNARTFSYALVSSYVLVSTFYRRSHSHRICSSRDPTRRKTAM